MRLAGTTYSMEHSAMEIFLAGCREHPCSGCHNPTLWNPDAGEPVTASLLGSLTLKASNPMISRIWVLGGEPLDNPRAELEPFLRRLSDTGKELWLWTHHELVDIPFYVLRYVRYVKTGRYNARLSPWRDDETGVELASCNQRIFRVGTCGRWDAALDESRFDLKYRAVRCERDGLISVE